MSRHEPTSLRVPAGSVELQAYDYESSAGPGAPDLVILHGIQDFALAFDPLAQRLRQSHRVISFDLRGHGDSDHSSAYTVPHLLGDLHCVLAHFQIERPVLIGHSLGSHCATQYAAIFPEVPSALISIDGLGAPMRESDIPLEDRQWRLQQGLQALIHGGRPGRPMMDLDDAAGLFCRFHPGLDYDLAKHLVELGTREHPHGGLMWKWDPNVTSIGLHASQHTTEERWGWITCPTLLITGGEAADFFVRLRGLDPHLARSAPEEIERRSKCFRNAQWVEIPEAGHMVHFDAPDRLLEIISGWL